MNIRNIKTSIRFMALLTIMLALGACTESVDQETVNLEKAIYCMDILENRPDLDPSRRIDILRNECFGETYIQHAPYVEDGRDAVLNLFENRYKNRPETSISIKRTASEGDLVWLHAHFKATPDSLGVAVIHVFRMEDEKLVEHWAVVQPVPEDSLNDNTMF